MPFPQRYNPNSNFSRDEALGQTERGEKLDGEFRRIAEITNQLNTFIRQFSTSNGRLQLDQAVLKNDIIDIQTETVAAEVRYDFDQPIDSAVDLVRTFVDGVRVDPAGYDDTGVDFAPAITGELEVRIYYNMAGVLNRIQAITDGEGASYIGYDDEEDRYAADNVRDALTEAKRTIDDFIIAVGDLAQYLLRDGSRTLTGQWSANEPSGVIVAPALAQGSLTINALPVDGDTFTADDGYVSLTYEWDDDASVTPGNTPVAIGASNIVCGTNLAAAINGSPIAITASSVTNGANADMAFEAQVPGTQANNALASTGAWLINVVGLLGGVDGSFGPALKTYFRIRHLPRSIQDGDAVVHQQLRDVISEVQGFVTAFLRVDGSNQMVAALPMGGNKVVDMAEGTQPTDGVRLSQLTDIAEELLLFVPALGRRDATYAAQADIKGPIGFYKPIDPMDLDAGFVKQSATDIATVPQDTGAEISTMDGVPTPAEDDHLANKRYVDVGDAILQSQVDEIAAETGSSVQTGGCGLGDTAAGLDITDGGEYHTTGDATITSAMAPAHDTMVRVRAGDLTITGTITGGGRLTLDVDGDVTISATLTLVGDIHICCPGVLTVAADVISSKGGITISALGGINATAGSITAASFVKGVITGDSVIGITVTAKTPALPNFDPGEAGDLDGDAGTIGRYAGRGGRGTSSAYDGNGGGGGGGTGGGNGGDGGNGATGGVGGNTVGATPINRPYLLEASSGGDGGAGTGTSAAIRAGSGGGVITLFVAGDLDLTGGVFVADGRMGVDFGGDASAGGGGGGTIKVSCTGLITNGTLSANGGVADGSGGSSDAGGGGGGGAFIVAESVAGVQTVTAAGGAGYGGSFVGDDGSAEVVLLTEEQILCLRGLLTN